MLKFKDTCFGYEILVSVAHVIIPNRIVSTVNAFSGIFTLFKSTLLLYSPILFLICYWSLSMITLKISEMNKSINHWEKANHLNKRLPPAEEDMKMSAFLDAPLKTGTLT